MEPLRFVAFADLDFGARPLQTAHKSKWTRAEDRLLLDTISGHGTSNWTLVAASVPGRTGKQCRERWLNQLSPNLTKENWSPQEDDILLARQGQFGNCWSKIAQFLPGRSSNNIKNRWGWLSRHRIPPPPQHVTGYPQMFPMPQAYLAPMLPGQPRPPDKRGPPNAHPDGQVPYEEDFGSF
jgi:hypothetical protein